jgi:hypothetical protein
MPDVALITVHGMGETPPDYAADLCLRLRARIGPRFSRQSISARPVAAGVWKEIDHWSRSLQGRALTESEKAFPSPDMA